MSASDASAAAAVPDRPVAHLAYAVNDLATAVDHCVATFGAGPFFRLDHIAFDTLEGRDGPVAWDHSAAIGQWGPIVVELHETFSVEPAVLEPLLTGRGAAFDHVGCVVDDLDAQQAALDAVGAPRFLRAQIGPLRMAFHDAPALAHGIELQEAGAPLRAFYDAVAAAAVGWDGADRLRPAPQL